VSEARPIRLVIDCDPGIDDALALLLAAASPQLHLLGVTTVAGNRPVDITAANACRVLDLAGRSDVPVYRGCGRPLAYGEPRINLVHREDGLGGVALPNAREPLAPHAIDFLDEVLWAGEGDVTLVAVGPLTNLALAEIKRPGLLRRAQRVLVMGGAAFCPGNITPSAEFNFYADAMAAHTVMNAGATLSVFGLDVTRQVALPAAWLESLAGLANRCGPAASAMLRGYARPSPQLHDVCPVAWLLWPALFKLERCIAAVDPRPGLTEGYLWARREPASGPPGAAPADVCTGVDAAALLGRVLERLASLP
jgi:purine nucleosidase